MGFMDIVNSVVKKILDTVLFPLKPIIDPILAIGDAMTQLLDLLTKIIGLVPKLMSLFVMFTDPVKLIKDTLYGVKTAIIMLYDATIGYIIGSFMKNFYLDGKDKKKVRGEEKCFKKSFINVVVLILCPPLAIFMNKGMESFFYVAIASFLTYFYYFPGLIYSCLYIL
tara:strand:- start:238 stop:741 length:504 start_codon:yes stop_codon:yes gene_type:complete